jgi:hypothetical protein
MRDLYTQGQAAFSNAQLEGQQTTQMELQNQQTQLQLVQQRQAILADTNLTEEQRAQQLATLGSGEAGEIAPPKTSFGQFFGQAVGVGGGIIGAGVAGSNFLSGIVGAGLLQGSGKLAAGAGIRTVFKALGTPAAGAVKGVVGKGIAAAVVAHPYVAAGIAVLALGGLIYAGIRNANQK